ncbi:hypothetical protein [Sphingopyxis macrogoltabida]|nr:hypothetical protein [Sphingopyxis macrogoltabida]
MRAADVVESAADGWLPAEALGRALNSSLWALTAMVDDEPHAMLGVASINMLAGKGSPWMLGTERIYDHARIMLRKAPAILGEMHRTFPVLENRVSVDNARARRFLRRIGFEFHGEPIMVGGIAFVHFRKGASDSV